MNLSELEDAMLRDLAEDAGVDRADILRTSIRTKHQALFGPRIKKAMGAPRIGE